MPESAKIRDISFRGGPEQDKLLISKHGDGLPFELPCQSCEAIGT